MNTMLSSLVGRRLGTSSCSSRSLRGLARHAIPLASAHRQAASASESSTRGGMTEAMYNWRVAAVENALAQRGKATGDLTIEDLTSLGHLDQYHYLGVEANDHVIDILGLDESVHVLDIGSGIGGPARYISCKSGCRITGVELQQDICLAGEALTKRMPGLAEKVQFKVGDIIELCKNREIESESFDHFMSLLVFLHIPDRGALLKACADVLRPGATFVIEDFAAKPGTSFTPQEQSSLQDVVSAPTVTSPEQYVQDLETAGFVDIEVVDLSSIWQKWTKARHDLYVQSKSSTLATQGEAIYNSRVSFYKVVDDLFAGNLGGVRITGRRPGKLESKLIAGRSKDLHSDGGHVHVVEGQVRARSVLKTL